MKHIVNVTISNPAHEFVSMRRRQSTTNYMVEARDEAEAIFRASNHFKKLGHYVHNAVIVESTLNEGVDQIDESAKVGPENYHKSTDTVWHSVHHNDQEIGTIGTHSAQHVEKHGKWGFEDSRGYGRRHGEPEMNSKEEALDALVNRHKEYTKKKTNEEVEQTDEAMQIRAYDKNGKLVGNYRSMADAKKFKPGHNYKEVKEEADKMPVAPVPGDKWKSHAVMVHPKTGQRVVVARKNAKNYPESDGWKEVAPGMRLNKGKAAAKKSDRLLPNPLTKKFAKEEVEQIDEVNANQIKKDLDSGMSHDAVIGKHANTRTTNTDAIREVIKQHAWDKRMKKEEVKQIDELKKSTIGRYIKKSAEDKAERQSYDDYPDYSRDSEDNERRLNKRTKGIDTAVNKLAKEEVVNEKAPPGAKYERMVKHIKNQYSKDGTLTPKEKAIAYATAWKAKNSGK